MSPRLSMAYESKPIYMQTLLLSSARTTNTFHLYCYSLLCFYFLSYMGDRRPRFRFRFRLPWLSAAATPRLKAASPKTLSPAKKSPPVTSIQPPSPASQETTFQPFGVAVKPSEPSAQVKEVAPITVAATEAPSAAVKPKERGKGKKVAEEQRKAATKGSIHEEIEQRTITNLLAASTEAGTKTRELLGAAFETGKRHQENQEDIERKKTWTTSSTDEKQIKTVSSKYPKDRNTPNNSHQKHVTSNWEQAPLHKEIREDISKLFPKLATGQPKLPTDEKVISVLTLAGENRGASFHLGSESTKKDGPVHIHRGYKINPDDSPDATTDEEGSSRGRKPNDSMTKENPTPRACVNSNTQSINNSIVLESSVNERNPGVYVKFLHNLPESTKSSEKAEPIPKAKLNIKPAEKLIYKPRVRRRCLRGLLAEPSDSDPDNPEKPQRHGCRYSCGQKNKEKETGAL
ncbi:muscle M-line assembly protein unc-89-like [Durio zibethinus]|uniref:Muscle M-line assembly protein unc-89-like n=1 Tax=Durio zibethinus TaxID=66656 RepID=A0A6P6AHM9_DURZI|nr:muscle M-line assembly protein unc-89-like [Durio zibethinus]